MRGTQRLPLELIEPLLVKVPEEPRPLVWKDIFGTDQSVEIEVGFGKGLFLLNISQAIPQVNFLGIEILRKYQLFTANRVAKRNIQNVRLAHYDARLFFRDFVASGSVQAVHVYFPDPWWKKRHRKRRVFTQEFASECARILQPGGFLNAVTDVEEYFEMITQLLAHEKGLEKLPLEEVGAPKSELDYLTNFERKFRKEGRPIYRSRYRRESLYQAAADFA